MTSAPGERKSGGKRVPPDDSYEVATRLPADRPLPDDGLFVDQSEMIYSMDSRSFYREWRTRAPIGPSRSSPCSRLLPD
ncbi:unnamed protein product [Spirodela intermedia]|uniref:Uncharacterized protein n=1 Tax=Spirodela intermedia TaxID=51605 RepID=A0A7I8K6D1_SPIIN|nr:unnamed protein product [Spirodela intermedia]